MKTSDQKMDSALKAFARRWMKSLDSQRPSTTLGYFFAGLFIIFWSTSLTHLLGFNLAKFPGALVLLAVVITLGLAAILIVHWMAVIGIDRPTRSALLFGAVIGPYVNMLALQAWNVPVVSHMLGFIAAILAFIISLLLDRLLDRPARMPQED